MALGGGLAVGAPDIHHTLVDLDAGEDAVLSEELCEELAAGGLLIEGLLKEDDAAEVLQGTRCGEEQFAQDAAVGFVVLDVDAAQTLADGSSGLVGGENALARGGDGLGVLDELL